MFVVAPWLIGLGCEPLRRGGQVAILDAPGGVVHRRLLAGLVERVEPHRDARRAAHELQRVGEHRQGVVDEFVVLAEIEQNLRGAIRVGVRPRGDHPLVVHPIILQRWRMGAHPVLGGGGIGLGLRVVALVVPVSGRTWIVARVQGIERGLPVDLAALRRQYAFQAEVAAHRRVLVSLGEKLADTLRIFRRKKIEQCQDIALTCLFG